MKSQRSKWLITAAAVGVLCSAAVYADVTFEVGQSDVLVGRAG